MTGPWEIVETSEYATWFGSLTEKQQAAVLERVALLREKGPTLNRPVADRIQSSAHHNMKELRIASAGAIRVLFAFDRSRRGVLLVGGIKSDESKWNEWYSEQVPVADAMFDRHLRGEEHL